MTEQLSISENKDELKVKWLSLFKGSTKREYKKRIGKEFIYKVSPTICFLQILSFSEIERLDSITFHTITEINEPNVYLSKFWFNSFTSDYFLDKRFSDTITSVPQGTFVITFSKPVNNYILAEITGHPLRLKQCDVKIMGRSMWMLFLFSKDEQLIKVNYSYVDR